MENVQSAAIPYRRNGSHELEVLLVSSRRKGRWVFPKGNVGRMLPHASAAREAFEEAGVLGVIGANAVGVYRHSKSTPDGDDMEIFVRAFPLQVSTCLDIWPEMAFRRRRWMTVLHAAEIVDDPELSAVLHEFQQAYGMIDPDEAQSRILQGHNHTTS